MKINKIILASILLVAGCSSNHELEDIYIDDYITEEQPAPKAQQQTIKYTTATTKKSEVTSDFSAAPKDSVFDILGRNDKQIKKIYTETTRKIYLSGPDDEDNEDELVVNEVQEIIETKNDLSDEEKDYTQDCVTYCGEGYYYDHNGELLNGNERICIKYPLSCGEECRKDWYIQQLIYDTNYTCQEAIQKAS